LGNRFLREFKAEISFQDKVLKLETDPHQKCTLNSEVSIHLMDDLILPARYETLVTPELNCN
jgi:hypothetical protein